MSAFSRRPVTTIGQGGALVLLGRGARHRKRASAGWGLRSRRVESPEAEPGHAAVEVGDALDGGADGTLGAAEVDLVRGVATPGGMRSVAVVPEDEIRADALEAAGACDQPVVEADGVSKRAPDPFDPAIRPGMAGQGESLVDVVRREEESEGLGAEVGCAIGEEPLGSALALDGVVESANDAGGGGPGQHLQGDEATAVVVDGTKNPDRDDAKDPDRGEVDAPEFARARDSDLVSVPAFAENLNAQVVATNDNLANGFTGRQPAEEALDEPAELAGAEVRELEVKADDILFLELGGAVPRKGPAPTTERRKREFSHLSEPEVADALNGAAPFPQGFGNLPLRVMNSEGCAEENGDEGVAGGGEDHERKVPKAARHAGVLSRDISGANFRSASNVDESGAAAGGLAVMPPTGCRPPRRGTVRGVRSEASSLEGGFVCGPS